MSGRENKIPILMYHEIYRLEDRNSLRNRTNPAYNTELDRFRRQMESIYEARMRTLTIDELLMEGPSAGRPAICLTFDDGWAGNYSNAYPVLKELGLKATFFVAADLIGKPCYMTWNQLKEMQASGMSIQSHTVTHRALGNLKEKEIHFELSESRKIIEKEVSARVCHLSLPHGSKSGITWSIANEVGYKTISTSDIGFQSWESDGPWLRRISIGDGISEDKFRLIIEGRNRAIYGMIIVKNAKNTLKHMIGMEYYRKFYQWVYNIR